MSKSWIVRLGFMVAPWSVCLAQGPLAPTGAPAPTMKTLDQVEARTVIESLPFTISQSGSYLLGATLTGTAGSAGITVAADDVTIDLNGFTLSGVAGTLDGIVAQSGTARLTVQNGSIRGWDGNGLSASTTVHGVVENVRSVGNGSALDGSGVILGNDSRVTRCQSADNQKWGIEVGSNSQVTASQALNNDNDGIRLGPDSQVSDCIANGNLDYGIQSLGGCSIRRCTIEANGGPFSAGMFNGANDTVEDCRVSNNTGDGLQGGGNNRYLRNHCQDNTGAGILLFGTENVVEENTVTGNTRGIDLDNGGNRLSGNVVRGNTDNYDFVAGNQLNLLLCEIPESIDWPASVKLIGSLTGTSSSDGITVTANDITIDLAQHTLQGAGGTTSIDGVRAVGATNLVVRNGAVRGWGGYGIVVSGGFGGTGGSGCLVEDVVAQDNGAYGIYCVSPESAVRRCGAIGNGLAGDFGFSSGIRVNDDALVEDCFARDNQEDGITAGIRSIVTDCRSRNNGKNGISLSFSARLERCVATGNGSSGFDLSSGSSAVESRADSNEAYGFFASDRTLVRACVAQFNALGGIRVSGGDSLVVDSQCLNNTGLGGIRVGGVGGGNRIEGNTSNNNGLGLSIQSFGNLVIRNSVSGNATNLSIAAGNTVGPTVTSATIAGSSNPHANYEH